jgi:Ice-binding-like
MDGMKKLFLTGGLPAAILAVFVALPTAAWAATSPNLGMAGSFAILSSTYTNTAPGTTLKGDLGYTTPPLVAATVNGTIFSPPSTKYSTAGTDQGSALANLNGQACSFTFPDGAIDLATDTTHGTLGIYAPGVYCTGASSAASIGAAGITLTGSGTFIFRVQGALTTVANSAVRTASGASACNVFWTPIGATTLGANSTFVGTDIDARGITIGDTITWTGQALAFGGTVSTVRDTITVGTCAATPSPTAAAPSVPPTGAGSGATLGGLPSMTIGVALLIAGTLISSTVWVRRRRG